MNRPSQKAVVVAKGEQQSISGVRRRIVVGSQAGSKFSLHLPALQGGRVFASQRTEAHLGRSLAGARVGRPNQPRAERCCLVTTPFPFGICSSLLYITFGRVRNGAVLHLKARRPGFIR